MNPKLSLAKPSGISLASHTQHVWEEAEYILRTLDFLPQKYKKLTGEDLTAQLQRACFWHDAGKDDPQWQQACQLDFQLYENWCKVHNKTASINESFTYQKYVAACYKVKKESAPHLLKAKLRHEFASLERSKDEKLSIPIQVAIAAHHGKLNQKHISRWEEDGKGRFKSFWQDFKSTSRNFGRRLTPPKKWESVLLERYKVAAIRCLLQLADTRASRKEAGKALAPLTKFEYDFPHKHADGNLKLRPVQQQALNSANKPVSILRAPTGSGKTDASLLWAKEQIDNGRADRLIIAMPTRFTSNALALNIEETVSDTGLYHSSAWYSRFGNELKGIEKEDAKELHKLAQLLATPVSVCTIDHLLMCLTGTKEEHHSTFFFLANACVVIDEADFYDSFIQANLQVLIKSLRLLKVPVLIMSATVPDSARQLYDITEPLQEAEREEEPARYLSYVGEVTTDATVAESDEENDEDEGVSLHLPDLLQAVFIQMIETGHGIVFANTVARGYAFYQYFRTALEGLDIPLIFYHSRFTEPDKKFLEEKLIRRLGRKAWLEDKNAKGIAILTQIGEMSINISAPLMYSDACPWDRLTQRIGRLNRFNESEKGIAFIGSPVQKGQSYPAPYGNFMQISNEWEATQAFMDTLKDIQLYYAGDTPRLITSREFVDKVNALYPKPEQLTSHAESNRSLLFDAMRDNWLIVPDNKVDEENGQAGRWQSRNIESQTTIYVQAPIDSTEDDEKDNMAFPFLNYDAFRSYQLEYGISVPTYLIKKGLKAEQLTRFCYTIGQDEKAPQVLYLCSIYNDEIGLAGLGITSPPRNTPVNQFSNCGQL